MVLLWFLVGAGAGALALVYLQRRQQRAQRRIPRQWPLKARPLLNSTERAALSWLLRVFADQQVFVKLPVTRFTAPDQRDQASHWYRLLNGVYCTFTVCRPDGRVVGCVDIHNEATLSLANQALKHSLLSQCGLRYWVVDPGNLPQPAQVRIAFLGDAAAATPTDPVPAPLRHQASALQATVSRQRGAQRERILATDIDPTQLPTDGPPTQMAESRLPSGWEHNSFVTPLDSRHAELG